MKGSYLWNMGGKMCIRDRAYDVRRDLPDAVQKEVAKQVGKRQVAIEIDKQSLNKAKAAIKDLFSGLGKFGK